MKDIFIKNKNYIILLIGQIISEIGNSFTKIALTWLVYTITKSSLYMGTVLSIQLVSSIISRLFVGVFLDKYNKKTLIIIAEFVRGFIMCIIPLMWYIGILNIWTIYLMAIFLGISEVVFEPALDIIVPAIVDKNEIIKANSIFMSASQFMSMLGPIISGIIISMLGAPIALFIDGCTFIFSAISIFWIEIDKKYICTKKR